MRYRLLFLTMFFGTTVLRANIDSSGSLRIGERCPDIVFTDLLQYSSVKAQLSDFKGKAIIIDFWATWCLPCVKAIPKLDSIQAKNENELKILMVSSDRKENIAGFYAMKPNLRLTTALVHPDELIYSLFPHREIPHYIWLDKDHVLRATTGGEDITPENVRKFLRGEPVDFSYQKDGAIEALGANPMLAVSESIKRSMESPDESLVFTSRLTRHANKAGQFTRHRYVGSQYDNRVIDRPYNYPIARLYSIAYGGYNESGFERFSIFDRVLVESEDRERLNYPSYDRKMPNDSLENWIQNNTYTYLLVLPPGQTDPTNKYRYMQRDLDMAFGYRCGIKKRRLKCLVLKATGDFRRIAAKSDSTIARFTPYGVALKNQTLDSFLAGMQKYINGFQYGGRLYLPTINETGWSGKVDLQFKVENLGDLKYVNGELTKYGLTLFVDERDVDVIVISDK